MIIRHMASARTIALRLLPFVLAGISCSGCYKDFAGSVEAWQPNGVSSAQFESHPAFDPRTSDLYFVRSTRSFDHWRILVAPCGHDGWEAPRDPSFAGDGVEADPWFTRDGSSLYFISTRSTDGVDRKDLDIWRVDRDPAGNWGEPRRLPVPVNSAQQEWFPRIAADGWLYFGSGRPGGLGRTDIWRALIENGQWRVENLGPNINSAEDEYEAEISSDGSRMIIMAASGLYESLKTSDGWQPRRRLPRAVNADADEVGPLLSPAGNLLFSRNSRGPLSGELFVWRRDARESWPPLCPRPTI